VVLDQCFMVNDIKVSEGRDGRFISMPSRRKRNGKFKDIAHPLNSETRAMLEAEILGEYDRVLDGQEATADGDGTEADAEAKAERKADPSADNGDGDGDRPARRRGPRRRRRERSETSDETETRAKPAAAEAAEAAPQSGDETPADRPQPEVAAAEPAESPSSLEEVTEKHLSDSFWTS
jgi:stage V sporulation protein G